MLDHRDLQRLRDDSLRMQSWIRRETFNPQQEKTLRRFSSWEVSELILDVNHNTFRSRLAADPSLPRGQVEPEGRQRWFSLEEIGTLRRRLRVGGRSLMPARPAGKRAIRAAISNFKGGAGKSTTALHFAHAAALDGYRVLVVDFDPQATLSHSMGLTDIGEEHTVWGIMARDLIHQTEAMNAAPSGAATGRSLPKRELPEAIAATGLGTLRTADFVRATCWPTIDIVPSCANAAFVEFASAQYRHCVPDWSFFAAVDRWLGALQPDAYDLVLFDCPPAIGYQSMNAICAADMLYIPSGPGYWEYDSTTSFIGQLSEALSDLDQFGHFPAGKSFLDVRLLLTRYEPGNELHRAMRDAYGRVFGERMTEHPIELTRAVEQSGRFLSSIYEIDYRDMTRETWRRARASFDAAYAEFRHNMLTAWDAMPPARTAEEVAA